jgi:hypothetical protein
MPLAWRDLQICFQPIPSTGKFEPAPVFLIAKFPPTSGESSTVCIPARRLLRMEMLLSFLETEIRDAD